MKVAIVDARPIAFYDLPREAGLGLTLQQWATVGQCYNRSEDRWIGSADDNIACIWGLIPPTLLSDQAYLWLYHNELVEEHKFTFIRHSQIHMKRMLSIYPHIVGECMITNPTGRKWLQWLGAKFGPPDGFLAPLK